MIEIGRYILALTVAQTHLLAPGTDWTGQIAVIAFYTLSGYLMTRVLNERYGFTLRGTTAFVLNRILRLWPAYLIILGLAVFALCFLPLENFIPLIRLPGNELELITNLTILGQTTFDFAQWISWAKPLVTSWSLSIEVFCYLLLALYFAKSPTRLWSFAILGGMAIAFSTVWCINSPLINVYGPYCFQSRYGVLQAGFLPFAAGGLYYFHGDAIAERLLMHRWLSGFLLVGSVVAVFISKMLAATLGPFIGVPLTWVLLTSARNARPPTHFEDFFGRASYHLFISHMPLAAILVVGFGAKHPSAITFFATIAAALGLSVLIVPLEWRINKLRRRISPASAVELSRVVRA
jgi:peptidoglycan/LPS O-acetylase OafA/YrhL